MCVDNVKCYRSLSISMTMKYVVPTNFFSRYTRAMLDLLVFLRYRRKTFDNITSKFFLYISLSLSLSETIALVVVTYFVYYYYYYFLSYFSTHIYIDYKQKMDRKIQQSLDRNAIRLIFLFLFCSLSSFSLKFYENFINIITIITILESLRVNRLRIEVEIIFCLQFV